jgi:hypothetical protein
MTRHSLMIVATGIVSGVVGAVIAGRMTAPGVASPALSAPLRPPAPIIVPPGWDSNWSARLDRVENDLAVHRLQPASVADRGDPSAESSPPPQSARERAEERLSHYQREVALHTQRLAEHSLETIDPSWSWQQGQTVHQSFETDPARPHGTAAPQRVQVDCRSKTCIAKLTFPTPMAGLEYLHSNLPSPAGCNGMASTPLPPKDNGAYDLDVVYFCRK